MHMPRELGYRSVPRIPGSDLPHVHRYFVEPYPYVGQDLVIIGGRNSAAEAAIRCYRAGARVAVSYRRDVLDRSIKYWILPELEWLIQQGQIAFHPSTVPVRIEPHQVELAPCDETGEPVPGESTNTIPADFVLPLIGFRMDMSLFSEAGVTLTGPNRRPQFDAQRMETDVPQLFVAGTAAAGSQARYRLFIENGHSHVVKIVRAICQCDPPHINRLAFSRLHEDPWAQEQ